MQLGSRWQAGEAPHPAVPATLHAAIEGAETRLVAGRSASGGGAGAHASSGASWTLTWLEGRPRVELLDASREVLADISIDADGNVVAAAIGTARPGAGAGAGGGSGPDGSSGSGSGSGKAYDDEDDDDWLS